MTVQRETVKVKYGKTVNMGDYNSVVMHIEETYLVPDTVDFDSEKFILMKATEYENIIDKKVQPYGKEVAPMPPVSEKVKKQLAKAENKPTEELEYRLDSKQQKKYKCPSCSKMDRLEDYKYCYACYIKANKTGSQP